MTVQLEPGNVRSLARAIRWLDDAPELGRQLLRRVYHQTGRAWVIGITGPAGVGKSTLINQLIRHFRKADRTVGVVAIDPTSPFTGGAILGDRIRMQDHEGDPGVFIRSVATRGQMGGLSRSTFDIVDLMDAYGMHLILIETVGVGQDEVDIARVAHTVVLTLMPGLGDEVQTLKAGLMEIAHVFVVNKKDRGDASRTEREIRAMLELTPISARWRPPIVQTNAVGGEGIEDLIQALEAHYRYMTTSGEWEQRRRAYAALRFYEAVHAVLHERIRQQVGFDVKPWIESIARGELDPYSAADAFLAKTWSSEGSPSTP